MEERRNTPRRSRPTIYSGDDWETAGKAKSGATGSGKSENVVEGRFVAWRSGSDETGKTKEKKTAGEERRPGAGQERTGRRENRAVNPGESRETAQAAGRARRSVPAQTEEQPQEKKRRRVQKAETKLRILWSILAVLVVMLAAAIVYELVLGYGTKETGAQRMERGSQQEQTANVPGSGDLSDEEILRSI